MKKNTLLAALISIVIGVLFCVFKSSILGWIMTILGILLIIMGVLDVTNKKITNGIIELVIGIAIIICGWTIVEILLIILGVLLVIWGLISIKDINKKNIFTTAKVIASIVLGLLLIINKFADVDWLFVVIGVVAIINGFLILLGSKK